MTPNFPPLIENFRLNLRTLTNLQKMSATKTLFWKKYEGACKDLSIEPLATVGSKTDELNLGETSIGAKQAYVSIF